MIRTALHNIAHLPGVDQLRAKLREQQQVEAFLDVIRSASDAAGQPNVAEQLALRSASRRPLSKRPRVVAFGHDAWERNGLWPTFERLCDFKLVLTPDRSQGWSERDREAAGARFLSELDAVERSSGPVELVYFYCDSGFLAPSMLSELSRRGIWTVLMGLDDQHKFAPRQEYGMTVGQKTVVPLVDLYWTTWKLGADAVLASGGRPFLAPEGADPAFHKPVAVNRDLDVVFVGARYGARERLVTFLQNAGVPVAAYGNGWPNGFLSFEQTIETFSRAKVVLGVGNVAEMGGVFCLKGRDFEVPMCGAVYLTTFNPDLADWFDIGREVLCYSSPENCLEVLRWILPRQDKQEAIRAAALARSRREHTWEARLTSIFATLGHKA